MPLDTLQLSQTKDRMMQYIKMKGPSLPVNIAREVSVSPLFASAFLSELYREQKLFMSHLKVGSTSLYLLPGQEMQLENFIEHLNVREREAFHFIKKNKIAEESLLTPVLRVAIRNIQDFATPIQIKDKTFWKYSFISDQEALALIEPQQIETVKKQEVLEKIPEAQITIEKQVEKPTELENVLITPEKNKKIKPQKIIESDFTKRLKEYLSSQGIEILQVIEEKKKEFQAKIRTEEKFGKQEYYLIAKDKKKIREEDLTLVLHKAQQDRLLALFMAPADLDIKAQSMLKEYRNLVKYHKFS